jgi:hypothetical protein
MDSAVHPETPKLSGAPHGIDDKIPNVLGPRDLMRVLGYDCQSTFYLHQRQGKFKRFELPRPIGVKRYSGRLVEQYLKGGK